MRKTALLASTVYDYVFVVENTVSTKSSILERKYFACNVSTVIEIYT